MAQTIRLNETGGPEVLTLVDIDPGSPEPCEALIQQEAIGVNYLDIMHRRGAVPIPLPGGLGLEGAGRVVEVGSEVTNVVPGDRVAYALGPLGSYAATRVYPADRLVKLPDAMGAEEAAAILFKGLTTQYLLKSTFAVGQGTVVLLYGASGGVGQILGSWARHLGATVIGVVSKPSPVNYGSVSCSVRLLPWRKRSARS